MTWLFSKVMHLDCAVVTGCRKTRSPSNFSFIQEINTKCTPSINISQKKIWETSQFVLGDSGSGGRAGHPLTIESAVWSSFCRCPWSSHFTPPCLKCLSYWFVNGSGRNGHWRRLAATCPSVCFRVYWGSLPPPMCDCEVLWMSRTALYKSCPLLFITLNFFLSVLDQLTYIW